MITGAMNLYWRYFRDSQHASMFSHYLFPIVNRTESRAD